MMEPAPEYQAMEKPPYSYVALIALVLEQSPGRQLSLRGIYEAIARRFPYYARQPGRGWQNSVRHNLSLNPCFTLLPRLPGHKGGLWTLQQPVHDMFEQGKYQRRRRQNRQENRKAPEERAAPPAFRYQDPAGYYLPPSHYPLLGPPWGSPLMYPNLLYPEAVPGGFPNEVPAAHYWEQEVQYRARMPAPGQETYPSLLRTLLAD